MPIPSPSLSTSPLAKHWLRFGPEGIFELRSGKVELGQGIAAALTQIACNALGIKATQIVWVAGDTRHSPDEGFTAGSQSIEVGGQAWQRVGDIVRSRFALAAAERMSCQVSDLILRAGAFHSPSGQQTSYHQLALENKVAWEDLRVDAEDPDLLTIPTEIETVTRSDLWRKFTGDGFIHDHRLPDMWHARILRGPHPLSIAAEWPVEQLKKLKGVEQVLIQNAFVALVGRDEGALVKAHAQARQLVSWIVPKIPAQQPAHVLLPSMDKKSSIALHEAGQPTPGTAPRKDTHRLHRQYSRPYIAHASIGPSCALASPTEEGGVQVWSHSQGVFTLRDQVAQALKLSKQQVQVVHQPGAGCYGHNGADDVAFDAAFIAHTWGLNVRVQWSREDELTVSPMGSASSVDIQAGLSAEGHIQNWHVQVWSHAHVNRPGWGNGLQLLGAWQALPDEKPPEPKDMPLPAGGGLRNAVPAYEVGELTVEHHFLESAPVRVSALRSLGAHANVFAIECLMDELSEVSNQDPVAFRLKHLADPRARHVVQKVAEMSNWHERGNAGSGIGYGMAYGRYKNKAGYCALVAQVEVSERVKVLKVWACVDAGKVVHLDGLRNQIEGGILQAISWSLHESVQWSDQGISSNDWENYPILSFLDVPELDIDVVNDPSNPSLGSGEVVTGPCAGALGNAVAHALGIRARHLPLTPENLMLAMDQNHEHVPS
ncbi:MAG: molybdopterin-dependent oxidoreductase [Comamonadaceae bacterium]|nr:molybdopterin-dependent oxidoreductase [Comamonadaceae bacterium]